MKHIVQLSDYDGFVAKAILASDTTTKKCKFLQAFVYPLENLVLFVVYYGDTKAGTKDNTYFCAFKDAFAYYTTL
jgi:hypothetical protein